MFREGKKCWWLYVRFLSWIDVHYSLSQREISFRYMDTHSRNDITSILRVYPLMLISISCHVHTSRNLIFILRIRLKKKFPFPARGNSTTAIFRCRTFKTCFPSFGHLKKMSQDIELLKVYTTHSRNEQLHAPRSFIKSNLHVSCLRSTGSGGLN